MNHLSDYEFIKKDFVKKLTENNTKLREDYKEYKINPNNCDIPKIRDIEMITLYVTGFDMIHKDPQGIDGYDTKSGTYAEVKCINIDTLSYDFHVTATNNVFERYENKKIWYIITLWNNFTHETVGYIIGRYKDMIEDMNRQHGKYINNLSRKKQCRFTLRHLIDDLKFTVVNVRYSAEEVMKLLESRNRYHNFRCEDIIPIEKFIFDKNFLKRYNEKEKSR